jgi:hypothetical protein
LTVLIKIVDKYGKIFERTETINPFKDKNSSRKSLIKKISPLDCSRGLIWVYLFTLVTYRDEFAIFSVWHELYIWPALFAKDGTVAIFAFSCWPT